VTFQISIKKGGEERSRPARLFRKKGKNMNIKRRQGDEVREERSSLERRERDSVCWARGISVSASGKGMVRESCVRPKKSAYDN